MVAQRLWFAISRSILETEFRLKAIASSETAPCPFRIARCARYDGREAIPRAKHFVGGNISCRLHTRLQHLPRTAATGAQHHKNRAMQGSPEPKCTVHQELPRRIHFYKREPVMMLIPVRPHDMQTRPRRATAVFVGLVTLFFISGCMTSSCGSLFRRFATAARLARSRTSSDQRSRNRPSRAKNHKSSSYVVTAGETAKATMRPPARLARRRLANPILEYCSDLAK